MSDQCFLAERLGLLNLPPGPAASGNTGAFVDAEAHGNSLQSVRDSRKRTADHDSDKVKNQSKQIANLKLKLQKVQDSRPPCLVRPQASPGTV